MPTRNISLTAAQDAFVQEVVEARRSAPNASEGLFATPARPTASREASLRPQKHFARGSKRAPMPRARRFRSRSMTPISKSSPARSSPTPGVKTRPLGRMARYPPARPAQIDIRLDILATSAERGGPRPATERHPARGSRCGRWRTSLMGSYEEAAAPVWISALPFPLRASDPAGCAG